MSAQIVSIRELRVRRQRRQDQERWQAVEDKRQRFEAERSALFRKLRDGDGDFPAPPGAA